MKAKIDNLDALFAQARFEVKDDGFSNKVISELPYIERIDKWRVFRDVTSQVAAVVAIIALVCVYAYSRFDYEVFNDRVMIGVEKFNEKTIDFSEKIVNLDRVASRTVVIETVEQGNVEQK